jgi:hypothetical protein
MNACFPVSQPTTASEISRLLAAAVISQSFRKLLLTRPDRAIAAGFNGEKFRLSHEQRSRIVGIKAASLAEFASLVSGELEN